MKKLLLILALIGFVGSGLVTATTYCSDCSCKVCVDKDKDKKNKKCCKDKKACEAKDGKSEGKSCCKGGKKKKSCEAPKTEEKTQE